jgi:integrin beta 1
MFQKITSSVEMKDTASGSVKVTYWSKCLGDTRMQTSKCDGLKVGDVVAFETEIVVTSCPADAKDRLQTFQIYPVGVGEALTIDLEMLCTCDCESSGPTFQMNSPMCKGSGTLACGICECHEGFFGRNCECNNKDLGESGLDAFKCRPDNATDVECSGRGNCLCGQCHCSIRENPEEIISGQFCECDNFSCDRHNSVLCSGPDHGVCECGTCKCQDGWQGAACECSSSIDTCKAPNGEICSGHGGCVCGRCECEIKEDVRYSGKYCEKCPTCPGRCDELRACVECQMYKKGPLKDPEDCARNCTLFVPISVEHVECELRVEFGTWHEG